jgi:hypothetical protein
MLQRRDWVVPTCIAELRTHAGAVVLGHHGFVPGAR